jgi:hypothetical protein
MMILQRHHKKHVTHGTECQCASFALRTLWPPVTTVGHGSLRKFRVRDLRKNSSRDARWHRARTRLTAQRPTARLLGHTVSSISATGDASSTGV